MGYVLYVLFHWAAAFVPERVADALPAVLLAIVPLLVGMGAAARTGRLRWLVLPLLLAALGGAVIAANLASASYDGPHPELFGLFLMPAVPLWPLLALGFTGVALSRRRAAPGDGS